MVLVGFSEYIEIVIVCLLIVFILLLVVAVGVYAIIYCHRKFNSNNVKYQKLESENKTAKRMAKSTNLLQKQSDLYLFEDNDPLVIKYKISHFQFKPHEKLTLKLEWIKIGGLNNSIRSHLYDLDKIYFRILLNNNFTNSIIVSEMYPFKTYLEINEIFIFQIQKEILKGTSFSVETFASFKNRGDEFFIGWIEIEIPEDFPNLPLEKEEVLQIPERVKDLYFKSVGYLCVSLCWNYEEIKVGLLATTYLDPVIHMTNFENFKIYLTVKSKNKNPAVPVKQGLSVYKLFKPTLIWNEEFKFSIIQDSRSDHLINIKLYKISALISSSTEEPKKIGSVKFGSGESFNKKAEEHWENVFTGENNEIVKWHPINANNK